MVGFIKLEFLNVDTMDLIRNDIIIGKMVVLVGGLCHVLIHSNQNEFLGTICGFHNMEP